MRLWKSEGLILRAGNGRYQNSFRFIARNESTIVKWEII